MGIEELHAGYEVWCLSKDLKPSSSASFAQEFDSVRQVPELEGKIRKFATRYYGIRLVNSNVAKLTSRKR